MMTLEEIRKLIIQMREERDLALAKANHLTQCIVELSKKRDQLIEESNPDKRTLFEEMFDA